MTNKEAIEILTNMKLIRSEKITEACDIAIKALEEVDKLKLEIFFANHTDDDVYR